MRSVRFVLCAVLCTCCSIAALLSTPSARAQATSSGVVLGVVTDQSNAVVAGATVTMTDPSTGTSQSATTNETGRFIFPNVAPGTYDVTISKSGFATTKSFHVSVKVAQATTLNATLQVGTANTVVEVTAGTTELQTLNATIGNTVTGLALESLPSLGRDVSTFVTLQPGVSPDGSVAGAVVDQSSFMLDGGNNTNDMDGSMQVYTPSYAGDPTGGLIANPNGNFAASGPTGVMPTPADSVEEFKVGTTNQTADFNNSSGMQVSVVTKRGTNKWHGTVYEYYLDNNFSGNTWDNNLAGVPVPSFHYNRFGGAVGGPLIPKEFLGGKTYFFANYQGFRWPNSETFERVVPSANMRNGLLDVGGTLYDLNAIDPRGIGMNTLVQQMWNTYMPQGNDPSCGGGVSLARCDGVNTIGFKANLAIPQNDNFGVVRVDHDFGQNWRFNSSYRYYNLKRATHDQVDIGGFFPGDKLGVPTALSSRPQVPWYFVAGLTTTFTSHFTNDFHYSFLRNWWAWSTAGGPAQLPGLGAALEPLGERKLEVLAPYNVNTQQTRTRFWDGKDHFFRDDMSLLNGNHLFQFGGQYQHNFNWHERTDNGGGINYYPAYLLGDTSGSGLVNLNDYNGAAGAGLPAAIANDTNAARYASAMLGIVTDSQVAYTRSGANLALNPPLTPAFDKSTIPYYNVYFSDTWHMRPSLTLTYGLGWTLEMPPVEEEGKQVELIDASSQPIDINSYLHQRKAAALKGEVFNPIVGYALVGNTANGLKYPYNPYYGSFSPRIAVAWNPDLGDALGGKNTVFRGGYGRIYGRLNGVDLVLVPLLGTGLIQPVQCRQALNTGLCGPANPDAGTAFRIGTDGLVAPLAAASPTLPQPLFPGINDVSASAGEALDPHFRPNAVDSFDFTIQHQFTNKISMEVGAISRWIHNEYQPININAVPNMMTLGGQKFSSAYANIERALGCATSANACGANGVPSVAPQPFFEAALSGTGYCNSFPDCTTAVVTKEFSNFASQAVWSLWSDLDTGGTAPGFNFPRSMLNSPLNCPTGIELGCTGQISGGVGVNASIGHGNYNAGFVSVKLSDWHGLTAQQNLTMSKALGTGAFVQATSEYTANDPFDLNNMYGVQAFDRRFVYTSFLVYQPPFFKGQQGALGRVLGGWTFAPVFAAGSGAPIWCNTNTGGDFVSGSGSQEFGAGDGENFFNNANCIQTKRFTGGNSIHVLGPGNVNLFADPAAVYSSVRPPILGIDHRTGGLGQFRGLPYWNLDFSVKKNVRITESVNTELQVVFTNVLNHNQFLDPILDLTDSAGFGAITTQGNIPRQMEFGIRVNF
jgi:Carboxypeptidase regulatory-like domain